VRINRHQDYEVNLSLLYKTQTAASQKSIGGNSLLVKHAISLKHILYLGNQPFKRGKNDTPQEFN
tara:strand:- start:871 stop:1065 length:195 start_codon:yes stop_codon:yes gene_type:complete